MTDAYEVIATLVDGERVNPESLKQALSQEQGRDYLVDVLALRSLVRAEEPVYIAAPHGAWVGRLQWFAATAALVIVAIGGTLFVTSRHTNRPPKPNHVIKLERGLDWRGN